MCVGGNMTLITRILGVAFILLAIVDPAFAAEEAVEAAGGLLSGKAAAGLGIAIAAFGGAIGQGKTAAAALEGIGRNPGAAGQMFTPMIVGLALIESLVIYALVIAFQISA